MLTEACLPQIPDALRKLYPFRTRKLRVGGQAMSFVDEGSPSAPPLLLLHGNPTWSFLYRVSIPKLAERFHVIAPDHIGFGLSDKPRDPAYHSLERHIGNFTALVEALELKALTVVMHDWGGPIGLGYVTRNPQNIVRLLLINTWAFPPAPGTELHLPFSLRLLRSSIGEVLIRRFNAMVTRGIPAATARSLPPEVLAGYKFPFPDAHSRFAMGAFARMIPLKPADASHAAMEQIALGLKNVNARVEILWGVRDPIFRNKLAAYLLRDAFPNAADPVFLRNASHFVPEDAPEQITDKILEIFKPKPVKAPQPFNIIQ